jgi:molybdate/tungstate transport system substrate-binding protein
VRRGRAGRDDGAVSRRGGRPWRTLIALLLLALVAGAAVVAAAACGGPAGKAQLRLIYAGSIIIPFNDLAETYRKLHPEVDVLTESHGSIQCIRQITELHRAFDFLVTADYSLVPPMMERTKDPDTGKPYADWYVRFATNRMVLAYGPHSRHAGEIDASNWYKVLTEPDVQWGLADPRFDAAGYRALMVLQLAERYYGNAIIFEDMTMGRFQQPLVSQRQGDVDVIHVPELLAPAEGGGVVMRGSSVQLLPLLESGDVDYAFEYESVVRQHGLKYVELPPQIDLGRPQYESLYRTVTVKIDARRFATVKPEFRGEVIGYAYTIPSNAPDHAAAVDFAVWLTGRAARDILVADHQPLIQPPQVDGWANVPTPLAAALRAANASGQP